MKFKIKILQKGDVVLNVFNYANGLAIAIKRKNKHIDVVLVEQNGEGIPFIKSTMGIYEGEDEIQIGNEDTIISTF